MKVRAGWQDAAMGNRQLAIVAVSCLLCACSDDDGTGSGAAQLKTEGDALSGIYQLSSITRNEMGCDMEGPAQSNVNDSYLYLVTDVAFGVSYVKVDSCADVADCQAKNQMRQALEIYLIDFSYTFSSSPGPEQLSGETAYTGLSGGPLCERPSLETQLLVSDGAGNLTIEARKATGDDYPPDSEGFCTTDLGRKASEGKPCSELEVVRASFVQAL
jgi:hypothetical protein